MRKRERKRKTTWTRKILDSKLALQQLWVVNADGISDDGNENWHVVCFASVSRYIPTFSFCCLSLFLSLPFPFYSMAFFFCHHFYSMCSAKKKKTRKKMVPVLMMEVLPFCFFVKFSFFLFPIPVLSLLRVLLLLFFLFHLVQFFCRNVLQTDTIQKVHLVFWSFRGLTISMFIVNTFLPFANRHPLQHIRKEEKKNTL